MGFFTSLLDFEKQLVFYSAYHYNKVNQAIHIIFVPTILWTVMVFLTRFELSPIEIGDLTLEWSFAYALSAFYTAYYLLLEPIAGLMYMPGLFGLAFGAHAFASHFGEMAATYALGIHVFSWISQFVGHGVFEGRAPALLDNLAQAFLLAPLFVWLEVLFKLGYRPLLQERLEKETLEAIEKWKRERGEKPKKATPRSRSKKD